MLEFKVEVPRYKIQRIPDQPLTDNDKLILKVTKSKGGVIRFYITGILQPETYNVKNPSRKKWNDIQKYINLFSDDVYLQLMNK